MNLAVHISLPWRKALEPLLTKFCATVDRHLVPKMAQYQDFGKVRREGNVRTRCEQVKRVAAG